MTDRGRAGPRPRGRRAGRLVARALLWVPAIALALGVATLGACRGAAAWRERSSADALAPASGRRVRAGDVELFIQEAGPRSGRPVLLVHGTGAWSEIWRPTLAALGHAGYHAIAVDVPPFGFSSRPAAGGYGTVAQGRRLAALLDALDLRGTVVVGHSFGARAAVEGAFRAPGRVGALVLVDAALDLPADGEATAGPSAAPAPWLDAALRAAPLREAVVSATVTNPRLTRTILRQLIADPAAATDARVRMLRRPLGVAGSTAAVGRWLPDFIAEPAGAAPPLSGDPARYAAVPWPTLVLWGALDDITPPAAGEALARRVPGATWHLLHGIGHIPALEAPAAFNDALLGFLRTRAPAAPAAARRGGAARAESRPPGAR